MGIALNETQCPPESSPDINKSTNAPKFLSGVNGWLNPSTKKAECFIINSDMNDFEKYNNMLLCRRVESIADYMVIKSQIQKSDISVKDKIHYCNLNEEKNYNHKEIDDKDFKKILKKIGFDN